MNEKSKTSIAQHLPVARMDGPRWESIGRGLTNAEREIIVPVIDLLFVCLDILGVGRVGGKGAMIDIIGHAVIAGLEYQSRIDRPLVPFNRT